MRKRLQPLNYSTTMQSIPTNEQGSKMELNAKQQEVARIVRESAVEFLAAKHGVSKNVIICALRERNTKLRDQFEALARSGIDEAVALAERGAISLQ